MKSFKSFLSEDIEALTKKAWEVKRKLDSGNKSLYRDVVTNKGLTLRLTIKKGKFDEERFPEYYGANEMYTVTAFHDGTYVGFADYYDWGSVENVKVEAKYRRQGVATAIYDFLDSIGFTTDPTDGVMERDGEAFWKNRKGQK